MDQNWKPGSPLPVAEIKRIFENIAMACGNKLSDGRGLFALVETVARSHGRMGLPMDTAKELFRQRSAEGAITELDDAVALVRDIELVHGIGGSVSALRDERNTMAKMLQWLHDECKVYPESNDEKVFAQRILGVLLHPTNAGIVEAISPGQPAPARQPSTSAKPDVNPASVLLHALDMIEGVAMARDANDLKAIETTASSAMRAFKQLSAAQAAEQEKAARENAAAMANLSRKLADAHVLMAKASAELGATTHWQDIEATRQMLSNAVAEYRGGAAEASPPDTVRRHRPGR